MSRACFGWPEIPAQVLAEPPGQLIIRLLAIDEVRGSQHIPGALGGAHVAQPLPEGRHPWRGAQYQDVAALMLAAEIVDDGQWQRLSSLVLRRDHIGGLPVGGQGRAQTPMSRPRILVVFASRGQIALTSWVSLSARYLADSGAGTGDRGRQDGPRR